MSDTTDMQAVRAEMQRTAYQKKAVSKLSGKETEDYAITYFKDAGYRAGTTGRTGQVYIIGGREGALPGVTGEIRIQSNVGKNGATMVTMNAAGERLSEVMKDFHATLRTIGKDS